MLFLTKKTGLSHLKERTERNCLNCNAQLQGKYCHICGQENIESRETVWHLVSHFFEDITHFDGKFFNTLKLLTFRPGFLSREYMMGRRASYLNPIRMYVFTSAFFFLIFFSFFKIDEEGIAVNNINNKTLPQIAKMDSAAFADFTRNINRNDNKPDTPMTREQFSKYVGGVFKTSGISLNNRHFKTRAAYDSARSAGTIRDNWLIRQLAYKVIDLNAKYNNDADKILSAFKSTLFHSLPQMLFISLPLLALLLKFLYYRRKQFYYVNHAIFSIHLYIFIFIAMLVLFGISKLNDQLHWKTITVLSVFMYLGLFFYEYKAIRNFYGQRRGRTILKFVLLNGLFFIVLLLVFLFFLFFSFFKI